MANKAEDLKKQLSQQQSRPLPLRFAGAAAKIEVTRAEFETMTADLLDRTIEIVQRTLATLQDKEPGATIDEVLLVGGSTRMPMVAARLTKEFGWDPKLHDPDLAVAKGAAIFALSRVAYRMQQEARDAAGTAAEGDERAAEVVQEVARQYGLPAATVAELVDRKAVGVLPKAFGVRLLDPDDPTKRRQIVHHLAFANDPLPIRNRHITARTIEHDQRSVEVALYEQAGTVLSQELSANNPLTDGSGVIDGIPPQPPGQFAQIDINMAIDDDGLLVLRRRRAQHAASTLTIEVRVGMSEQELDDAVSVDLQDRRLELTPVPGFDPKAYEDGVLKPLRPRMPNLPDDLLTRYAVEPGMDAAALRERVETVVRLWNKHAMRTGPARAGLQATRP